MQFKREMRGDERGGANEQNDQTRRILFPRQSHTLYLNVLFPC